ncbi:DUF3892 domain-containing protein [Microbacterium sp. NPDC058062]|uniref:DUF3892 domain-containing protein n=1 Tax=Microbacterium sp. NPDC058062 TaxID=3346320 RepID=UPI0036DA596C
MAIEITHVRFSSTDRTEEEIVRYRWKTISNGPIGESDGPSLVKWIESNDGEAYVASEAGRVEVRVIRLTKGQSYLRAHADGEWTNDLVGLPTF